MKSTNKNKTPDVNLNNSFDTLCKEFDGRSFYGLEYILEDFFQNKPVKSPAPARPSVDWFGLYE